jgi:hypothetical protein
MDQNRLRRICEMALSSRGVTITEFRALPTHQYDNEKCEWIPDSYSLFLGLRRKESTELEKSGDLESFLETLLGFECVVDFD